MRVFAAGLVGLALLGPGVAQAQEASLRPDQAAFRAIYKELVETNTTLSVGSCTQAAAQLGARLKSAGFVDADLTYFALSEKPREGGLVAILKGSDPKAGAVLLLGHLDVVEARREDWTRDPFTLIEEGGYFYARGTSDMKGLDAIWVDTLMRLKQGKTPPKRTLKMALTCGEETNEAFNGASWLANNRPDLANALMKIQAYTFPVKLTDTTRAVFALRAERGDAAGAALKQLLVNPADTQAARTAATDINVNSILHTNCVATRLDAGHASNALPQRARAIVNCRIFPGETWQQTRDTLVRVMADPKVSITALNPEKPVASPPPLDPKVIDPMKAMAARHFPGVPLLPSMSSGATDALYFGPVKLPIYGVPGIFGDPDGNGVHGLNERTRAKSLYEGRDYLFDLVKAYVGVK